MANRFNALYHMGKHLDEHGRFHFAYATIRPADDGISSTEWERGVRMLRHDEPSAVALKTFLIDGYYDVLDQYQWAEYIDTLGDGTDVPSNNFVYPKKHDKWDTRPEIY